MPDRESAAYNVQGVIVIHSDPLERPGLGLNGSLGNIATMDAIYPYRRREHDT